MREGEDFLDQIERIAEERWEATDVSPGKIDPDNLTQAQARTILNQLSDEEFEEVLRRVQKEHPNDPTIRAAVAYFDLAAARRAYHEAMQALEGRSS